MMDLEPIARKGIVKLASGAHSCAGWPGLPSSLLVGTRHRLPFDEGPCSQHTVMRRPQQMPAHPEEILHHAVDRGKALQVRGRFKATHLAFPLARRLVRDLRPIVRVLVRDVDDRRHRHPARRRVAAQLVGDEPARDAALALQQCPEGPRGGAPIPSRLDQDVDQVPVLVDGPPQVLLPA